MAGSGLRKGTRAGPEACLMGGGDRGNKWKVKGPSRSLRFDHF